MSFLFHPNFPFTPKKVPFFYGWVILAVSTMGMVMSAPGQTMGVSVFTDYLIEALQLSRVQLSTAYMLGTIASSFLLPWGGRMFDRAGARLMGVLAMCIMGSTLIYLSQCDRISLALFSGENQTLRFSINFLVIFAGFAILRFSGQGLLAMTSRAMLGKWFNRRRGFTSGVSGVMVSFFFSAAPLGFDHLVNRFGWRGGWIVLAVVSISMAGVCWLLFRDNPEECGLQMDGIAVETPESTEDSSEKLDPGIKKEFTVQEAYRTYAFWIFTMGLVSLAMVFTAITFHIVSVGEEMGLTRQESLEIFLPMAVVGIISNLMFGWLSDRFHLKYMLMVMMLTQAAGIWALPHIAETWGNLCIIICFGIGTGIFGPLMIVVWPKFYGRKHLGAISSLNLSAQVFGSAIGPFLFGLSYEWTGSYETAIYSCMLIPLAVFLASFKIQNPQDMIADA